LQAPSGPLVGGVAGEFKFQSIPNFGSPKTKSNIVKDADAEAEDDEEDEEWVEEGIIQPFHSFVLSLTMILFSEVGDKTFLVAALMAMKHDRAVVFTAAFTALIAMTVLSALFGHAVPTLIPKWITAYAAAALFLIFGARLMKEGYSMDPDEGVGEEMKEVEAELEEKEQEAYRQRKQSTVTDWNLEAGRAGPNKKRSSAQYTPPSSSSSPHSSRSPSPSRTKRSSRGFGSGLQNLFSLVLSPAWVQTFVMTFLGEWGDRSQIATIAMAAGQDYWWVTLGAVCGHACCTAAAVLGGKAIAGRVSMRIGELFQY
jgi:Ca2+/H+ antiporter, TMEM165/GDT1 family